MIKHPRFYKGRFYNDEKDSVRSRLLHAAKVFFKSLPMHVLRSFKTKGVEHELSSWMMPTSGSLAEQLTAGYSVTWVGHSTFLIQLPNFNILTDPVFFNVSRFFPRHTKAAVSLSELPKIDFVLLSHNHRDHLEIKSLKTLFLRDNPTYLVPFGDEKLLKNKGFANVFQKHWWNEHEFDGVESSKIKFTFLPAVHWSGRGPFDINRSLWGSWMIESDDIKIYFAGDSASGAHFGQIGQRFAGINLALMPIGPCQPREFMAESHLDPEEAVQAFLDLGARHFIPMHWGTFKSGFESVLEPIHSLQDLWGVKQDKSLQDTSLQDKSLNILKLGQTERFD